MIPLFDYEKYRLIMESYFPFQGYDFLYFDTPVNFYTLFRGTRKINTFNEFEYIAEVLIYLNPNLEEHIFNELMLELGDKSNKHVIRTYSEKRILTMCDYVFSAKKLPFCRRRRKIVFNPSRFMKIDEKRAIIGAVASNKTSEESIYLTIEELMEYDDKITLTSISDKIGCSRQTISNKITDDLRKLITYHNNTLKEKNDKNELFDLIDSLTSGGSDKIKVRALKKLTSIRDYNLIKNSIKEYFDN